MFDKNNRIFYLSDDVDEKSIGDLCFNLLCILEEDDKKDQKEKDYSDTFIDAYKYSYFLSHLEGKVFKGDFCGYSVTPDNSDKYYFVEDGIRGRERGYFTVIDNKLIKLDPLQDDLCLNNRYKKNENSIIEKYINPKLKYLTEFLKLETLTDNERMMIKDHIQSLEFIINSLYKI